MEYNSIGFSITGRKHLSLGKCNEDGFKIYEDSRILVMAVADGCSESPCARAATDAVLEALLEFAKGDIWNLKNKQLKSDVLKTIDKHLLAAPYEYRLLACTCAVVIINKLSNDYVSLSIGDTQAAVVTDQLESRLLLSPINLLNRNRTVFANSSMASTAMKIETGSVSRLGGFVLITDGADILFESESTDTLTQLSSMCVLSKEQAQAALEEYVSNELAALTNDDITVVMAMRSDDENISKIAAATCNTSVETNSDSEAETDTEEMADIGNEEEAVPLNDDESSSHGTSLVEFLKTPRTAEEIVIAGYCLASEVVTSLTPFIKEGIVSYGDYHFVCVTGGSHV